MNMFLTIVIWMLWISFFWGKNLLLWQGGGMHPVYTTISISVADICALIVACSSILLSFSHSSQDSSLHKKRVLGGAFAFLSLLTLTTLWAWYPLVHVFWILRILWWVVACWGMFFSSPAQTVTSVRALVCVLCGESALSLFQVFLGHSVGVGFLGEPQLATHIYDVAKIELLGHTWLRGYGTLPHPNVLAALLLTGIVLYRRFVPISSWKSVIFSILVLGVLSTGSKLGIMGLLLLVPLLFRRWSKVFAGGVVLLLFLFVLTLPSTWQRLIGMGDGLWALMHFPLGVGFGAAVDVMSATSPTLRAPWDLQPVHSGLLLFPMLLGIPTFLLALFLLWKQVRYTWQSDKRGQYGFWVVFMLFFLFEHFFFTLWQGAVLLALLIVLLWNTSMAASDNKKAP